MNWGVLGTADIAYRCTIPAMQIAKNCTLKGIAGRNKEKTDSFKEKFGFEKAYYSLEDMLADDEIQAVYIPLPNDMHAQWTKKAADAGKHILCEKPLTGNYEDTKELIEYCDKKGVVMMEAFAYVHTPHIAMVKEIMQSGEIGDIEFLESCFFTPFYTPENIRVRRETLGGSVYDLGCYCTSLMLDLFGGEPDEIKAVGHFTDKKIDDLATAYFWYNDGRKAVMSCGMCSGVKGSRFFVYGTKGKIEVPIVFNDCGEKVITVETEKGVRKITEEVPNNYTLEVEKFQNIVEKGEKPIVTHEFTLANARTLDRILKEIGY